jgi:hypothetical protein
MNIITTQASRVPAELTLCNQRLQSPKLCGDLYLLYTHSRDPFSDD